MLSISINGDFPYFHFLTGKWGLSLMDLSKDCWFTSWKMPSIKMDDDWRYPYDSGNHQIMVNQHSSWAMLHSYNQRVRERRFTKKDGWRQGKKTMLFAGFMGENDDQPMDAGNLQQPDTHGLARDDRALAHAFLFWGKFAEVPWILL